MYNQCNGLEEVRLPFTEGYPELEESENILTFYGEILLEQGDIFKLIFLMRQVSGGFQIAEYILTDFKGTFQDVFRFFIAVFERVDLLESHLHDDAEDLVEASDKVGVLAAENDFHQVLGGQLQDEPILLEEFRVELDPAGDNYHVLKHSFHVVMIATHGALQEEEVDMVSLQQGPQYLIQL